MGKNTPFSTNGAGSTGCQHVEEYISISSYSPLYKAQLKLFKDLPIKPDMLNQIDEKVGKSLNRMGTGEIFLNRTPMAHALRSII